MYERSLLIFMAVSSISSINAYNNLDLNYYRPSNPQLEHDLNWHLGMDLRTFRDLSKQKQLEVIKELQLKVNQDNLLRSQGKAIPKPSWQQQDALFQRLALSGNFNTQFSSQDLEKHLKWHLDLTPDEFKRLSLSKQQQLIISLNDLVEVDKSLRSRGYTIERPNLSKVNETRQRLGLAPTDAASIGAIKREDAEYYKELMTNVEDLRASSRVSRNIKSGIKMGAASIETLLGNGVGLANSVVGSSTLKDIEDYLKTRTRLQYEGVELGSSEQVRFDGKLRFEDKVIRELAALPIGLSKYKAASRIFGAVGGMAFIGLVENADKSEREMLKGAATGALMGTLFKATAAKPALVQGGVLGAAGATDAKLRGASDEDALLAGMTNGALPLALGGKYDLNRLTGEMGRVIRARVGDRNEYAIVRGTADGKSFKVDVVPMNEGGVKTSRHYQVENAIKRGEVVEVKPEALEVYKEVFGAKSKEVGNVKGVDKGQVAAKREAGRLIREARVEEPAITRRLEEIAKQTDGKLVGLEHRFKSEESLARKLADRADDRTAGLINKGYSREEALTLAVANQVNKVNDALRYTITFQTEHYIARYEATIDILKNQGYKIDKIWNAWELAGTPKDPGYRGINVTLVSPNGQKFELQFHTPESYKLKSDNHLFYEEARANTTSEARKAMLLKLQIESAKSIPIPTGINQKGVNQ
jgi:hypothetical protein